MERYLLLVASFASPMKRKGSGLFSRMDSIKSKTSDKRKSFIMTSHNSDDAHYRKQTLYGKTSGLARNFATSVRKGRKPTISMRHPNKNDSKMESKELRSPSVSICSLVIYFFILYQVSKKNSIIVTSSITLK